ncbi:MAG: DUF2336 domain-containing protein [Magnetospirillum sp. WYHS-4]
MTRATLSEEDVRKLLSNPSGANRAETAAKIATDFGSGRLSPSERALAEEIFRLLVRDAEVRVREALAQNLKQNPAMPHDVALALARDVASVALPVLQFSDVLTDDDLIEIIKDREIIAQVAIATRAHISETVSGALVESRDERVVSTLVANQGASITEQSLQTVISTLGDREMVQAAMVNRSRLPVTVIERLVAVVSEKMREQLIAKQDMPADLASDLLLQTRERATVTLSTESDQGDVERMVRQIRENGRLTPSLVLRALCMGDLRFFEAAMAELVRLPLVNVRQLLHDSGRLGLKAIFDRSGLPPTFLPAVRAAIDVAREIRMDGGENDRERYSRRMIERILTQYGDLGVTFEASDLEYLLAKMGTLPHDTLDKAA